MSKRNGATPVYQVQSEEEANTVGLALALKQAQQKGWITSQQFEVILDNAVLFKERLIAGDEIMTDDLQHASFRKGMLS